MSQTSPHSSLDRTSRSSRSVRWRSVLAGVAVLATAGTFSACRPSYTPPPEVARRLPVAVDYNFHVKPILSDRCYACHGPDENKRKAELRLDIEDGARPVLRQLVKRVASHDPEEVMPPPESNLRLTDYEKAVIAKWVGEGAEFKPHWAFIPPESNEPPSAPDSLSDMAGNGIDPFVLTRVARESLRPNPRASREVLIRRASFDLTGLPPTIDEIDAFLADDSPQAWESVVDRLLASPAYGEHMATEWLDIARYADSHGYQDDGLRNMWPWRDWVIGAFNDNMPFDEFVTVQLAGDLLPDRTRDQLLATGFNRNHLQSQEGGIVPEEYRVDYVADRTATLGRAFLGLTVECSRCHDHKYDPISQREYYQLFAFFNSVNEFGNIPYAGEASPTVVLTSAEDEPALALINGQIDSLEVLVDPAHRRYDGAYAAWLDGLAKRDGSSLEHDLTDGRIAYYPLDDADERKIINAANREKDGYLWGDAEKSLAVVDGKVGAALKLVGDPWIDMGKEVAWFERNEPFSIGLWLNITDDGREGPLFNKAGGLFNGLRGYVAMLNLDGTLSVSLNHVFPANSIEVQTVDPLPKRRWMHLVMTYDGSSRAKGINLFLDGDPLPTNATADNLRMSILYQVDPRTKARSNWGDPGNLRIGWMENNMVKLDSVEVDEFMVFDRRLTPIEIEAIARPEEARRTPAPDVLRDHYVTRFNAEHKRDFARLTALRGEQNEILTKQPEVMVVEDLPQPRPTYILNRGAYDAPTEPVQPGAPAALLAMGDDLPPNRLGLAEWLLDPRHPLTSRVAVNRMWQRFFGRGLVATPDDFGNQGARPTYPELLDWLAVQFIEGGWNVKEMQKLIVMSATYQQSSSADERDLEIDPDNELFARGPSFRLSAEQIRDNALAASGLLNRTIGGEPVKPYQPAGLWEELATRNATTYVQDTGDKLYRRTMYTIWKRTTPPPSMVSFDAADRNVCTVRRQSTNTPLQALVLLNDPQYVESARVLAERVMHEESDESARLIRAFRLLTSRRPVEAELALLTELVHEQRAAFAASPSRAANLLAVGEHPRDRRLDPVELATYAVAASTLMSFDEVVIRR